MLTKRHETFEELADNPENALLGPEFFRGQARTITEVLDSLATVLREPESPTDNASGREANIVPIIRDRPQVNDQTGSSTEAQRCVHQYREHLGLLLDCTQRLLPAVRFDKRRPQHVAAMCLYATILQSIEECRRLMDRPTVTVPGIMRSVLESYADLCAVIVDPEYPKKMLATLYEEQRRHLQDVINDPQNPFHAQVAAKIDPKEELSKVTASLAQLRKEGHLPLRIKDRLGAAGLANIYRTIYWELCLHDHNNLAALESRHIRRTGATEFEIDAFAENSSHQLGTSYDILTGMLADSSRRLYRLLEFSPLDEFNQQVEAFERFRPEAVNVLSA